MIHDAVTLVNNSAIKSVASLVQTEAREKHGLCCGEKNETAVGSCSCKKTHGKSSLAPRD